MRSRRDSNQSQIAQALREIGVSVLDLSQVAGRASWRDEWGQPQVGGCPDLLAAGIHRGSGQRMNVLIEVKAPRGKLRPGQEHFRACWRGPIAVVRNAAEARAVFGVEVEKEGSACCSSCQPMKS